MANAASLPESYRSVAIPKAGTLRKMVAFAGPGYLVSVGYMDPGNWATDLAGGSSFGYTLLSVIVVANFVAILMQTLSARLGIATGRDLAQACRDHYPAPVALGLWVLCELAICACDLAEVIGTAIALNLLFGIPLTVGVCLTAADVLLILALQRHGFRWFEAFSLAMVCIVAACFAFQLAIAQPVLRDVLAGLVPSTDILTNPKMLYVAIGIVGATVMPHNLYLHSSIVQTRSFEQTPGGKREAARFATVDTAVALMFALFINAAILVTAAAVFGARGQEVTEIKQAYELMSPTLGVSLASTVFALALLVSGQNSAVTATLAGQIVMEGFLRIRLTPWVRRLATRLLAIVPAVTVTVMYGDAGATQLLVLSQVVLSLQLPFAVVPLLRFTSDRETMGDLVSPRWLQVLAWFAAVVIVLLNIKLVMDWLGA